MMPCPTTRTRQALLAGAWLTLALGCKGSPPEQVSVKGRVVLAEDVPVPRMVLRFFPQDEFNKQFTPEARPDQQGRFNMDCLKGRYKVVLTLVREIKMQYNAAKAPLLEDKTTGPIEEDGQAYAAYQNPQTTPWTIEIPEQGTENLVLNLK
jgi:hypothetical protein